MGGLLDGCRKQLRTLRQWQGHALVVRARPHPQLIRSMACAAQDLAGLRHELQPRVGPRSADDGAMAANSFKRERLRLHQLRAVFDMRDQRAKPMRSHGRHGRTAARLGTAQEVVRLEQRWPGNTLCLQCRRHEGRRCCEHFCRLPRRRCRRCPTAAFHCINEPSNRREHLQQIAKSCIRALAVRCRKAAVGIVPNAFMAAMAALTLGAVWWGLHVLLNGRTGQGRVQKGIVAGQSAVRAQVDHGWSPAAHLLVADPRRFARWLEERLWAEVALDRGGNHHVQPLKRRCQDGHAQHLPRQVGRALLRKVSEGSCLGKVLAARLSHPALGLYLIEATLDLRQLVGQLGQVRVAGVVLHVRLVTASTELRELIHLDPSTLVLAVEAVELPLCVLGHLVPDGRVEPALEAPVNAHALLEHGLWRGPPVATRAGARLDAHPLAATAARRDAGATALQVVHLVQEAVLANLELLGWRQHPEGFREGRGHLPRCRPPLLGRALFHVRLPLHVRPGQVQHAQRHHEMPKERKNNDDPSDRDTKRRVPIVELERGAGDSEVRRKVTKPLTVWKVLLPVVPQDVQPQD
mmetsp:Transcript_132985/g.370720  ORF Transcript_132985/g.370720 Transcript_132985/m.370720 type:complete len:579 (-) Transcript_132985:632-2368(-)